MGVTNHLLTGMILQAVEPQWTLSDFTPEVSADRSQVIRRVGGPNGGGGRLPRFFFWAVKVDDFCRGISIPRNPITLSEDDWGV